ncbi:MULTISPECIES: MerR family transcriptional regulator [unclassified Acinetobacter]|uniref:MerR family transcriptional regulator n=1 Tax=unclassified Acinetobacter TaxID=196816 RepID=UPI00244AE3AA|nr:MULTISPECIES: MerR family transcriptional regulator [unclassified Acinetobacter]MDH0029887.1 MerR family transcriptional regulator [Acinetobacter sp. GD04021]MDH0885349.1 MerR family transcriptional regulator [Acinetobacter sp. GD03873]MDH1081467.1 MerR family transcriptional regulator [Acinetobacter sp. GD03983]MDH2188752.1 MerR family transcriptional regulator [Acinetobacter sp. GD03645]MDH2203475.1 MerR family transcriptional regulator [Acinetobacter sp. GD03647]
MLIGELAKQAQLSRDTIRFYEKMQLIQSITRNNGYKDYPEQTLQQLQLIRSAKNLGFSLGEIQQILEMTAQDEIPAIQVQGIFQEKLNMIDEKIAQLHQIRTMLSRFTQGEACPLRKDCPIPELN